MSVWGPRSSLILQIHSLHQFATVTSSHVPLRRRGIIIAIFGGSGTNCMVPSDWDLAPKCVCSPNCVSYFIGQSPILSAACIWLEGCCRISCCHWSVLTHTNSLAYHIHESGTYQQTILSRITYMNHVSCMWYARELFVDRYHMWCYCKVGMRQLVNVVLFSWLKGMLSVCFVSVQKWLLSTNIHEYMHAYMHIPKTSFWICTTHRSIGHGTYVHMCIKIQRVFTYIHPNGMHIHICISKCTTARASVTARIFTYIHPDTHAELIQVMAPQTKHIQKKSFETSTTSLQTSFRIICPQEFSSWDIYSQIHIQTHTPN